MELEESTYLTLGSTTKPQLSNFISFDFFKLFLKEFQDAIRVYIALNFIPED